MKKLILTLASVFVLSFGVANASSINSVNTPSVIGSPTALSSNDQAMLFGGEANAMILDNEEMKNTQGFGFWSSIGDFFKNPWNDVGIVAVGAFCALTAGACVLAF